MPSIDRNTGKRQSGAQQRKQARQQKGPAIFEPLPSPPLCKGVEACLSWANEVGLRAYMLVESGTDMDLKRASLITKTVACVGMLRHKALRSEQAVGVRQEQEGVAVDLFSKTPPLLDPLSAVAWAYFALIQLLEEICKSPLTPSLSLRFEARAKVLARLGYIQEMAETKALVARLEKKTKKIHSVPMTHALSFGLSKT